MVGWSIARNVDPIARHSHGHAAYSKGGSVTFGNNAPTKIMCKCTIILENENVKSQNDLYFVGIKHDLVSVSQMCNQGYDLTFLKDVK